MLDGKDWDEALAKEILEANKPTFALIEKGLACREFQVPEAKTIYDKIPYVFDFMQMARLMQLHTSDLATRDLGREAVERTLDVVSFGYRIECAKGGPVNWLVGRTIKGMGLEQLRRLVIECKVPAETLQAVAVRLTAWEDSATGLAYALRCEYQMDMNMIDEVYLTGLPFQSYVTSLGDKPPKPSWYERLKVRLFLRPNKTKGMFAESIRTIIEDCAKHYDAFHPWPVARQVPYGMPLDLTSNNSTGRMLYQMVIPAITGGLSMKCQTQTDVAATRAIVALKAFKMKTGRLPKALDELVPEYLAAVPLDDFDGKPLRYSPEKKILYSVGKDLKDVGGSTKEEAIKWWQKENPGRPPEDAPVDPPGLNFPNPSWPIEF